MSYSGIKFEHVWSYQIKCMMANQYDRLIEAIANNKPDDIIAVCLRLGWNDAFRHVSKNVDASTTLTEISKLISSKEWNNIYSDVINRRNNFKGKEFKLNENEADKIIFEICISLVPCFKSYLIESNTKDRITNIESLINDSKFKNKFK